MGDGGGFGDLRVAVEDAARRPPFGDVLSRASRVRRRRARGALVVLGSVAVLGLGMARPITRITQPPPVPPPVPGPAFEVNDVAFADARTGYVVIGPCAGEPGCPTTRTLARTDDGGRTWHHVTLPFSAAGRDAFLSLQVQGSGSVSLLLGAQRYVSRDAGRTWQRSAWMRDTAPVEQVPAGQTVALCEVPDLLCGGGFAALDATAGVQEPLLHQPVLPSVLVREGVGVAVGDGDTLWVAGQATTGEFRVARSTDRGRTWQAIAGPVGDQWLHPIVLAGPGTPRVYLAGMTVNGTVSAVWRLDDVGTGAWTAVTPRRGPRLIRDVALLPDGELRYTEVGGGAWQTTGAGTATVRASRAHVDGMDIDVTMREVVDGVLVGTPALGRRADRVLFSSDNGEHWRVAPVRF